MAIIQHKELIGDEIHSPFSFIFADAASRTSVTGLVEGDLYKLAVQESDHTFWMLINVSPVTWKAV